MKKFKIKAYYTRTESLELETEIEANSETEAIEKFKKLDENSELNYNDLKECGEITTELDEDDISAEEVY